MELGRIEGRIHFALLFTSCLLLGGVLSFPRPLLSRRVSLFKHHQVDTTRLSDSPSGNWEETDMIARESELQEELKHAEAELKILELEQKVWEARMSMQELGRQKAEIINQGLLIAHQKKQRNKEEIVDLILDREMVLEQLGKQRQLLEAIIQHESALSPESNEEVTAALQREANARETAAKKTTPTPPTSAEAQRPAPSAQRPAAAPRPASAAQGPVTTDQRMAPSHPREDTNNVGNGMQQPFGITRERSPDWYEPIDVNRLNREAQQRAFATPFSQPAASAETQDRPAKKPTAKNDVPKETVSGKAKVPDTSPLKAKTKRTREPAAQGDALTPPSGRDAPSQKQVSVNAPKASSKDKFTPPSGRDAPSQKQASVNAPKASKDKFTPRMERKKKPMKKAAKSKPVEKSGHLNDLASQWSAANADQDTVTKQVKFPAQTSPKEPRKPVKKENKPMPQVDSEQLAREWTTSHSDDSAKLAETKFPAARMQSNQVSGAKASRKQASKRSAADVVNKKADSKSKEEKASRAKFAARLQKKVKGQKKIPVDRPSDHVSDVALASTKQAPKRLAADIVQKKADSTLKEEETARELLAARLERKAKGRREAPVARPPDLVSEHASKNSAAGVVQEKTDSNGKEGKAARELPAAGLEMESKARTRRPVSNDDVFVPSGSDSTIASTEQASKKSAADIVQETADSKLKEEKAARDLFAARLKMDVKGRRPRTKTKPGKPVSQDEVLKPLGADLGTLADEWAAANTPKDSEMQQVGFPPSLSPEEPRRVAKSKPVVTGSTDKDTHQKQAKIPARPSSKERKRPGKKDIKMMPQVDFEQSAQEWVELYSGSLGSPQAKLPFISPILSSEKAKKRSETTKPQVSSSESLESLAKEMSTANAPKDPKMQQVEFPPYVPPEEPKKAAKSKPVAPALDLSDLAGQWSAANADEDADVKQVEFPAWTPPEESQKPVNKEIKPMPQVDDYEQSAREWVARHSGSLGSSQAELPGVSPTSSGKTTEKSGPTELKMSPSANLESLAEEWSTIKAPKDSGTQQIELPESKHVPAAVDMTDLSMQWAETNADKYSKVDEAQFPPHVEPKAVAQKDPTKMTAEKPREATAGPSTEDLSRQWSQRNSNSNGQADTSMWPKTPAVDKPEVPPAGPATEELAKLDSLAEEWSTVNPPSAFGMQQVELPLQDASELKTNGEEASKHVPSAVDMTDLSMQWAQMNSDKDSKVQQAEFPANVLPKVAAKNDPTNTTTERPREATAGSSTEDLSKQWWSRNSKSNGQADTNDVSPKTQADDDEAKKHPAASTYQEELANLDSLAEKWSTVYDPNDDSQLQQQQVELPPHDVPKANGAHNDVPKTNNGEQPQASAVDLATQWAERNADKDPAMEQAQFPPYIPPTDTQ